MAYLTVAKRLERAEIIKNSRFIALVTPLTALSEVEAQLDGVRAAYPAASHHCYAYHFGEAIKFSDDGEPGGTAGRPMLEVLTKRDLDRSLAVVTRYFGGTRLGAGGLVRAYSGSVAKALDEAGVIEVKDRSALSFTVPFDQADGLHRLLNDWSALNKEAADYKVDGLYFRVTLLSNDTAKFKEKVRELTRGQVRWIGTAS